MQTIQLSEMCPAIFQNRQDLRSDVWNQHVVLEKGKTYLIEAMSGTGKSSLCNYICGYRNDYAGNLLFDDRNAAQLGIREWAEIRSKHISHLIQDLRLFPELTAFENIEIKNQIQHYKTETDIMEWMDFLGIADKKDVPVKKMSFGQQQRVAMIRALVQPFDFLFADEPVSHLDEHNAQLMGELLTTEAKKQNAGIIVTSIGKHINIHYDQIYHL